MVLVGIHRTIVVACLKSDIDTGISYTAQRQSKRRYLTVPLSVGSYAPLLLLMDSFVSVKLVWTGERFITPMFRTHVRASSCVSSKLKEEINMMVLSRVIICLTCLDRFEDSANPLHLMNRKNYKLELITYLSQYWHLNGLSPLCVLL